VAENKYITVFIPTFNGEKYLHECIQAVFQQELPKGYKLELLIIDSGSTDKTLDIINRFVDKLTLIQIPNTEFSHGGTRDRAAHLAKGDYILYLTQDATPAHNRWLINMIEPFQLNKQVGCVFGKQLPRKVVAATIKREVSTVFAGFGPDDAIMIHRSKSLVDNKDEIISNYFFSDVNSAIRRDLLIGKVPFRTVNYAEDQALAEDMQTKGYLKAYAPLGEVWHSNEYTARQYFHRKFDEFVGLQESTKLKLTPNKRTLLLGWVRPTIADYKFILRDKDYGFVSKLWWLMQSPLYNFGNKAAIYYSAKHFSNAKSRDKLSLEKSVRKNNP
jgi:rhamnosyltransferase